MHHLHRLTLPPIHNDYLLVQLFLRHFQYVSIFTQLLIIFRLELLELRTEFYLCLFKGHCFVVLLGSALEQEIQVSDHGSVGLFLALTRIHDSVLKFLVQQIVILGFTDFQFLVVHLQMMDLQVQF